MLYLSVGKYFITNVPREKKLSYLTLRSVVVSLYSSIFREKKISYYFKATSMLKICPKIFDQFFVFFIGEFFRISVCVSSMQSEFYQQMCMSFQQYLQTQKIKSNHGEYFRKKVYYVSHRYSTKYMWFYCVLNDNTIDDFILIRHNIYHCYLYRHMKIEL